MQNPSKWPGAIANVFSRDRKSGICHRHPLRGRRPGLEGLEPRHLMAAWVDQDISTPNVIDIHYDFRDLDDSFGAAGSTYHNGIAPSQIALAEQALEMWSDATRGMIRFTRDQVASLNSIINIGTGDLAVRDPYQSAPGGTLGLGIATYYTATQEIFRGLAWMDFREAWDEVIGNGYSPSNPDYFSAVAHEIGHALGLSHIAGANLMNGTLEAEWTALSRNDVQHLHSIYDEAAPSVSAWSITGSGGAALTTTSRGNVTGTRSIEVHLTDVEDDFATDDQLEVRYQINGTSNDGYSKWEAFTGEPLKLVLNADGRNWINVQVRDPAQNVKWVYDSVILDRSAPTGQIDLVSTSADAVVEVVTKEGNTEQVTRSQFLQFQFKGVSDGTGDAATPKNQLQIRYSVNGAWSGWQSYADVVLLPKLNYLGKNWIVVQIKDEVANTRTIYDSVILDRKAPSGKITGFGELYPNTITPGNDGLHTSARDVRLLFQVDDNISQTSSLLFTYRINSTSRPDNWQPVTSESIELHLDYVGTNWVNVWFKDEAGNILWSYAKIILDSP